MRYFQFFDDWLLDGYRDLERGYGRPELIHTMDTLKNAHYQTVHKTPEGRYRMWYRTFRPFPEEWYGVAEEPARSDKHNDIGFREGMTFGNAWCYAESDDGLHFEPVAVPKPDVRFADQTDAIAMPRSTWAPTQTFTPLEVYDDPQEADEQHRFKALNQSGRLFTSPDGFDWLDTEVDTFHTGGTQGSDMDNAIRWNPVTQRYQILHRPGHWDRRLAISESKGDDYTKWGEPRVVMAPDVLDPPCHQFQGLAWYPYEDMWIGWLQHFDCAMEERGSRRKMNQKFHEEMAYSHNGRYWQRTRETFFPKPDPPAYGCGMHISRDIIDEGDHLHIYSAGSMGFAGRDGSPMNRVLSNGLDAYFMLLVWKLRKDGFCYLQPKAGYGHLWTRGIVPQDEHFTLNVLAPYGQVRLQLSDEENKPLPGFSFDECEPIKGDHLAVRPRWKNADLASAVGKWCRIEMELFDARLYAFRWNAKLAYVNGEPADYL